MGPSYHWSPGAEIDGGKLHFKDQMIKLKRIPSTAASAARWECERIGRAVERFKFCHADACVQITISIGFHLNRPDNSEVESQIDDLIDKAEQALYRAKKKARTKYRHFIDEII